MRSFFQAGDKPGRELQRESALTKYSEKLTASSAPLSVIADQNLPTIFLKSACLSTRFLCCEGNSELSQKAEGSD